MIAWPRLGAAAVLVGLVAVLWLATPVPDTVSAGFETSASCRACHADVWDEWAGSHHRIAYTNPEVQRLSDGFRNQECAACHLPRPVAWTGYGRRTLPRATRFDEGVGCIDCHVDQDGRVVGVRDRPDAPCAPRGDAGFASVDLCASCHDQHGTTDQWRASPAAAAGVTCHGCHMPESARAHGGTGRDHAFRGAHDADMLRSAGRFDVGVDGRELVLALTNTGAGHDLPTEERHRAVDIVYRFVGGEGQALGDWQRAFRFRQPYRDEPGEDTQLPAGVTKTVQVAIPAGAAGAEARLWYRLQPYVDDDHPASTLLFERAVTVR
jgi:hypothetical protein